MEFSSGLISTEAVIADISFGKKIDENTDFVFSGRIYQGKDFAFYKYYDDTLDYGRVKNYKGELAKQANEYPIKNFNLFTKIKHKKITIGADWQHSYETNAFGLDNENYAMIESNVWGQDLRHIYLDYRIIETKTFALTANISAGDYFLNPETNFSRINGGSDYSSYTVSYKAANSNFIEFNIQENWKINKNFSLIAGAVFNKINSYPKTRNLESPYVSNENEEVYVNSKDSLGYLFGVIGLRDSIFKEHHSYNIGGFLQTQYKIFRNLKMTFGARYDYNSDYKSNLTPRFGMVYSPTFKFNIKYIFGTAYIQPSNFFKWENWGFPGGIHVPNIDIKPEEITTNELSFNYFLTKNTYLRASFFRNEMKNIIRSIHGVNAEEYNQGHPYYNPYSAAIGMDPNAGFVRTNVNLGEIYSQGFELELTWMYKNFISNISYSYVEGKDKETNKNIPKISNQKINLNSTYRYNKFFVSLSARYFSDIYTSANNSYYGENGVINNSEKIKGSIILYTNFGYKINNYLDMNLSIDNFLNKKHYAIGFEEIQGRIPQALRKIYFGIKANF